MPESHACEKLPRQEVTINICLASRLLRLQRDSAWLELDCTHVTQCSVLPCGRHLQVKEERFEVAKRSQRNHRISVTFIFEIIVMDKCNFAFINYCYCLYFTNLFLNYVRPEVFRESYWQLVINILIKLFGNWIYINE